MSDIVEELDPLFNPKSVAVIGATNSVNKWGFTTFTSMLQGFDGPVYPVNWAHSRVLGREAYKRVIDIPGDVDLALFVIPGQNIPLVMEDCVEKGVRAGVIIAAGFREVGEEGKELEDEVLGIARRGGLRFVGPNCMGMWSATSNLRAYMFPMPSKDGPLAFVTQGGNLGGAIAMASISRGIGFHRYVSCGAAADIQIEDYIEYFGKDPDVEVILAYIEGLSDGRRFIEKVKEVTKEKPVIALKPCRGEATARAISSHSGSLAGSSAIYDEAFRKSGTIRTNSESELLDVAFGFLTQPLPKGRNVAIMTPGGSYGVMCADACEANGLNVIKLSEEVIEKFNRVFPPRWSHGNPVDPAGDRNFIGYMRGPEMLLRLDDVDSLIFMGFGGFSGFTGMIDSMLGPDGMFGSMMGPMMGSMSSMFTSLTGMDKLMESLTSMLASGDTRMIDRMIRMMTPMMSRFMGPVDDESMEEFKQLITTMLTSGRMDLSSMIGNMPELIDSMTTGEIDFSSMGKFIEQAGSLISGMMIVWIEKYKKPILATTFTEGTPRMEGDLHPFSSGEKVARVLTKLVEYKEYLERIGVYDEDFDRFKFCQWR
jgi:succinyl-CoA synthetase alpha subunit